MTLVDELHSALEAIDRRDNENMSLARHVAYERWLSAQYKKDMVAKNLLLRDANKQIASLKQELYDLRHPPVTSANSSAKEVAPAQPQHPVLDGVRIGRLVVIGLNPGNGKARYTVRCDCGNDEIRTSKALYNYENRFDCCHECRKIMGRYRSEHFSKTGEEVSPEQAFSAVFEPHTLQESEK